MRRGPCAEAAAAAAVAAAVLTLFLPMRLRGLSPYWGDLSYLHQAWRSAPAQLVQAGRAPLWEPSLYLGMPMAASMQGALFYPATALYYFFGFADATLLFHLGHYFLAGWLACLWLRTLRLRWGACVGGGLSFALGGLMISRVPFLNHLAVLAWSPALLLLFRRPAALGAALALMFLAGYPAFLPGCAAAAWCVALALRRRGPGPAAWALNWVAASALALALGAAQLLPGLELAALSRRAAGVGPAEALQWGLAPGDLRQWLTPWLVPLSAFRPEVDWWKCVYLGLAAAAAAALGLARLPRRRALALAAVLAAVVLLTLGGSNPLSALLWARLPPLRFVRYPGNLSYLALLPLAALVGAGLARAPRSAAWTLAIAVELVAWGRSATPEAPRGLFVAAGPLVRALQAELDETRYLISPRALESSSGVGVFDWKERLYGLTNAPYRLRAVGNFGEPLVPALNYAFMDRLYGARGAAEAAAWLPWAGASRLLTPAPPPATPLLVFERRALWALSRSAAPAALAYRLAPAEGDALPAEVPAAAPPAPRQPLRVEREREDRYSVSGEGAGWAYVAEPRYPGWSVALETPGGRVSAAGEPALGPFQKVRVPQGPWTLRFRYEPASWRLGVLLSLAALLGFGSYWYHRAARPSHVA